MPIRTNKLFYNSFNQTFSQEGRLDGIGSRFIAFPAWLLDYLVAYDLAIGNVGRVVERYEAIDAGMDILRTFDRLRDTHVFIDITLMWPEQKYLAYFLDTKISRGITHSEMIQAGSVVWAHAPGMLYAFRKEHVSALFHKDEVYAHINSILTQQREAFFAYDAHGIKRASLQ